MTRATSRIPRVFALIAGLMLASAPTAHAQAGPPRLDGRTFVNVSAGMQLQTRSITTVHGFELFDETATVTAAQTIGRGLVIDASVGQRVWRNLVVSLDVSTFHQGGINPPFVAVIPSPAFFHQFTTSTGTATDLGQSTIAASFVATWVRPVTDKFDVAVFFGPSFLHVSQTVASVDVSPGTLATTPTTGTESKNTGKAGMVGVDLLFKLNERSGVGVFVRYAGGEVDLPSAPKTKVGGVQTGVGLRWRF